MLLAIPLLTLGRPAAIVTLAAGAGLVALSAVQTLFRRREPKSPLRDPSGVIN